MIHFVLFGMTENAQNVLKGLISIMELANKSATTVNHGIIMMENV